MGSLQRAGRADRTGRDSRRAGRRSRRRRFCHGTDGGAGTGGIPGAGKIAECGPGKTAGAGQAGAGSTAAGTVAAGRKRTSGDAGTQGHALPHEPPAGAACTPAGAVGRAPGRTGRTPAGTGGCAPGGAPTAAAQSRVCGRSYGTPRRGAACGRARERGTGVPVLRCGR